MAEAVVNPLDLDTAFHESFPAVVASPGGTTGILAEVVRPVVDKHGMVAGFSAGGIDCRTDVRGCPEIGRSKALRITVLRMRDAAAAERAAAEAEAADFAVNPDNARVEIPKYPEAHSHWRPTVPTLGVIVAHGDYLVALFIIHPSTDLAAMTTLATQVLDRQLPRLDSFTPTPVDALTELPLDTDGMLRRLLPDPPGQWMYPTTTRVERGETAGFGGMHEANGVVWGPGGADHLLRMNARDRSKPDPAGIDRIATNGYNSVLRAADAPSARRYFETEPQDRTEVGRSITAPTGVPDAQCFRLDHPSGAISYFQCHVLDGRYVAAVVDPDEATVRQMAAAQYALLVRNR
ncbi:hypothetical protein [Nocardia sp. NPDC050406]|uniref:DUF7373 family lipoprotein n=1 Tax=Nocardia sp. NPDC050406 TaxID=3364318 RepID=UPI003790A2BD